MKKQSIGSAFKHAFNGMFHFMRTDRNGKIHFAAAMMVTLLGMYFRISNIEWIVLLLCFAIVIGFEMINHALEHLSDVVHAEHHPFIKTVKDVAAAAVLWAAISSAVIGLIVFVPKIINV